MTDLDTCTATLTLDKSAGFSVGMNVLIIQMQGASINIANSANFGSISDLHSAGLYERARISSVTGNQVILENILLNNYDTDGSVQLISLPAYQNAIITDTLTAEPWDGQIGGVLALEVTDTLTFNAPIDVSGIGFQGGIADIQANNNCNALTNANAYYYDLSNWRGAAKGEGIAKFIADREAGRGAQATGGGGGNDHNSGGGGGANAGAGGNGGENNEPDFLGCDGRFPGIGGKAIPDLNNRIFLGGGGGAGHENNDVGSDGGNGGGIVILIAHYLQGNNQSILAKGITPPTITGDGGGGGGAGGTVLLDIKNVVSPVLVQAQGGDGGSIDNKNGQRCHGPGGGGSGGRLVAVDTLPISYELTRGEAGMSKNSSTCGTGTNGAQAGADGFHDAFTGIPQSEEVNIAPVIVSQPRIVPVCVGQSLTIPIVASGAYLQYQWQVDKGDGTGFQNIPEGGIYTGTSSEELNISSLSLEMTNYLYQVLISNNCFTPIRSEAIPLSIVPKPNAQFDFIINGTTVNFNNTSTDADEYFWDFGEGQISDEQAPSHTFAQSGSYTVTLTAINLCDSATFSQTININAQPSASFTANPTTGCLPLSVTFQNTSSANATSFAWILPGGTPNFSTLKNPTVTYNTAGKYAVMLIASNANGIDTLRMDSFVVVKQLPTAAFTVLSDDLSAQFNNNSTGSDQYSWNFGDDATSNEKNPTHSYSKPGNYIITLIVNNNCGSDTTTQTVTVGALPQARFTANRPNGCAPHLVQFSDASSGVYESREWEFPGGNPSRSTEPNPQVIYNEPGQYNVKLIVTGNLGSDTLQNFALINVLPSPTPAFTFQVEGTTVTFTNTSANAQSYFWTFGDGQTSSQQNPVHLFTSGGVYTVTLNASNAYCGRSTSKTVAIGLSGVADLRESGILISPNPTNNQLFINTTIFNQSLDYHLYNLQGQHLQNGHFSGKTVLDLSAFASGMYLLQLQNDAKIWIAKIVKQ